MEINFDEIYETRRKKMLYGINSIISNNTFSFKQKGKENYKNVINQDFN